jgi:hypothetical protein
VKGEAGMAIIECVFEYDENTEKVSQVVHILGLDSHDEIKFVTPQQGLALECEEDFPLLHLKTGDFAPVKHTSQVPTNQAPKFKVYYHGPQAKFQCGELTAQKKFIPWKTGIPSPGGDSGPA